MRDSKYNRSITLLCPTCGNSELQVDDDCDEQILCPSCDRYMTKDELIRENGENIDTHLDEVKTEIKKDISNIFKNAFKGSKSIRFK